MTRPSGGQKRFKQDFSIYNLQPKFTVSLQKKQESFENLRQQIVNN